MASFQAIIVWKRMRKREIKIIVPFRSNPTRKRKFQKNSKKIQKKLKNTIAASLKAKIGTKRPRKRQNKNYSSVPFLSDAKKKFKKNRKKFKKLKYSIMASY